MLKKILDIYNEFLILIFKMKISCVDYEKFTKGNNFENLSTEEKRKKCKKIINFCTFVSVILTFLATLPLQVYISITLAVLDFLQFQIFLNIVQQKVMYIYQEKDLRTNQTIGKTNGKFLLWLQTEAMFDMNGSVKNKLKTAGSFIIRKSISLIFTKSPFRLAVMTFIRQFLKWVGVVATHELVINSLDILVTVICALIAALVSLWQFYPMCKTFLKNINKNGIEYYREIFFKETVL